MTRTDRIRHPTRRPIWAALLLLTMFPACLVNGDTESVATVAPATIVATQAQPLPSSPTSPTVAPVPSATPTIASPADTSESIPAGQEEDLPHVALAYEIDATLRSVESGIVDATSSVTITNQATDALDHLFFRVAPAHYNEFSLNSLTRDGSAIQPVASDAGTTLEVVLDPPLAPGATSTLRFDFIVSLQETGDGYASIGRDGQVLRLGYWYPMLSNDDGYPPLLDPPYTLTADYAVTFTAPAGVVVAASGQLAEQPDERDGRVSYSYTLDNGRDFALMLSPDYGIDERTTASGIIIRFYTLTSQYGDSDATRQAIRDQAFTVAERSLAEYQANIGPYPWPSLALVEAGPGLGGGIEYTALTLISYDSDTLDNLIAHEVAHMWFYAAIGTRTQADPWVDEGAATFLGNGISSGDYAVSSDLGIGGYIAPLGASVDDLATVTGGDWVAAVYGQGGSFYANTYVAMGANDFWDAMRAIYDTQVFAIVTPWEILTTFQSYSQTDLLPIYERYFSYEWLDETGVRDSGLGIRGHRTEIALQYSRVPNPESRTPPNLLFDDPLIRIAGPAR